MRYLDHGCSDEGGGREGSIVNNGNTFFPLKHAHISLAIIYNVFFISSMYLSL